MTASSDENKAAGARSVKKLSLKKETIKDLDAGPPGAKELDHDQLGAVNGGKAGGPASMGPQACGPAGRRSAFLPQCAVPSAPSPCKP